MFCAVSTILVRTNYTCEYKLQSTTMQFQWFQKRIKYSYICILNGHCTNIKIKGKIHANTLKF